MLTITPLLWLFIFIDDDGDDKMQILGEYEDNDRYEYELIGVTVHTGTADGGHYYSFIRDRLHKAENGQDKWCVVVFISLFHFLDERNMHDKDSLSF